MQAIEQFARFRRKRKRAGFDVEHKNNRAAKQLPAGTRCKNKIYPVIAKHPAPFEQRRKHIAQINVRVFKKTGCNSYIHHLKNL
jgi:hypothetical protein